MAVEGLRGLRFVPVESCRLLDAAEAEVAAEGPAGAPWRMGRPAGADPGAAFLAPLDPLAWDRDLLLRLWGFDYRWEVYVPAAKRRWGYYVLPLLYGDRIVGRIEPRIDRRAGALRVLDLWWEDGFDPLAGDNPGFVDALAEALRAHIAFAGLERVVLPRTVRHRALSTALRERLRHPEAAGTLVVMSVEIRGPGPDEYAAAVDVLSTAFLERPDVQKVAEELSRTWAPGRTWVAWDDGRPCGTFRSWGTQLTVPGGRTMPAAAVSAVTVLPTHRRRGILTGWRPSSTRAVVERGETFAILYASEYPIYGRFGYAPATRSATWTVRPRETTLRGAGVGQRRAGGAGRRTCCRCFGTSSKAPACGVAGEIWRRDVTWELDPRHPARPVHRHALEGLRCPAP